MSNNNFEQQNYPSAYEQYNSAQMNPQNAYAGSPYDGQNYPGKSSAGKGLGIASLVLGILAFLSGWIFIGGLLGLIGLILGIVSLVQAKKGKGPKGMAITGIVLSIIGILSAIVMGVLVATVFEGMDFMGVIETCQQYENDQAALEQCITSELEENLGVSPSATPTAIPSEVATQNS